MHGLYDAFVLSGARHTSLRCEKHTALLKRPLQGSQAGNILGERFATTQRANLDVKANALGPHAEEHRGPSLWAMKSILLHRL